MKQTKRMKDIRYSGGAVGMQKRVAAPLKWLGVVCSLVALTFGAGAQDVGWSELPPLPGAKGWAGMFAGVSDSMLFCMGGANFPDKLPWKGGTKKWSSDIYMLRKGAHWTRLPVSLPEPLGYGVSVSYRGDMILVGGSNAHTVSRKTYACRWDSGQLLIRMYPDLPVPLSNMAGARVNSLLMVVGGVSSVTGEPLRVSYGLDLDHVKRGWFALPDLPGPGRILPMCADYQGRFFLFSGERTDSTAEGMPFRHILEDAYCFTPRKTAAAWTGSWRKLAPMPQGKSAGASPVPVLNDKLFFWGGVDPLTALNTDPANPDAISKDMFLYDPARDTWQYLGKAHTQRPRVTLPAVYWDGRWVYVSGEVSAGVRTNTVISLNNP